MFRRVTCCMIAFALVLSLAGCNDKPGGNVPTTKGDADPKAAARMKVRMGTPVGRGILRLLGVRLPARWDQPESPEVLIGKISPTPVLLVHGRNDHLFSVDHAIRLFDAAGEPKRLFLSDRFGHGEDGLGRTFAARLSGWIRDGLAGQRSSRLGP